MQHGHSAWGMKTPHYNMKRDDSAFHAPSPESESARLQTPMQH
ncbi:hypothetical protein GXY_13068 [Novacetimonas hansenii ATCC 23769]|uniref:Uncharacterized protein n=1 Tax=Novacetimonas hansenii ATCC 23769 TaxID=714995 RepID=D5QHI5_NOVHA|nr:hypothetical protein GXY_13068 [Novacetimonas hansenii ATCC 23769]